MITTKYGTPIKHTHTPLKLFASNNARGTILTRWVCTKSPATFSRIPRAINVKQRRQVTTKFTRNTVTKQQKFKPSLVRKTLKKHDERSWYSTDSQLFQRSALDSRSVAIPRAVRLGKWKKKKKTPIADGVPLVCSVTERRRFQTKRKTPLSKPTNDRRLRYRPGYLNLIAVINRR